MDNKIILDNMFLKENIDNNDKILEDISNFQKLNDNEISSLCTKNYATIFKMQKDRFNKFNLKRIVKIEEDKKSKKQEIQKEYSKNVNGTSAAMYKNCIIYEEYRCYDDVIYDSKEKVYMQYLINYNNDTQNGLVDGYNIEYFNETIKSNLLKNALVIFLYLLFLTGLFFKVKSIGDSIFFGKFVILAIILSVIIIRMVPKIRMKRNKKLKAKVQLKDSRVEKDFACKFPLMSLGTFMLDLGSKIKAIHYANNEIEVSHFVKDIDLFEVIKSYENIVQCSISDMKLLNISQNNESIKINLRCIAKLYEFSNEINDDLLLHKGNENCNNINVTNEEILITIRALRDNTNDYDFKICEYKILK